MSKRVYRKCIECGANTTRHDKCGKCYGREQVAINCRVCGVQTTCSRAKLRHHQKQGGKLCKSCYSKHSSNTMKKARASTPKEIWSAGARKGNYSSKRDYSSANKKQWRTIKSNPELYKKNRDRLKKQAIEFWKNVSEERKNEIIKKMIAAKPRSKGSDALKQGMTDSGLYDGFESEVAISGFVADEANKNLRIIVEYYGDVYHCNPKRYKDPNEYLKHIGRTVGEQWLRDRRRLGCFYKKQNYTVVIVWESDFKKDPDRELRRIANEIALKKEAAATA